MEITKSIFDEQRSLITLYQKIEGLPAYPLNLDLKESQVLVKDFIYRAIEELGEAYSEINEAFDLAQKNFQKEASKVGELYWKEMGDFLSFFVELSVFMGLDEIFILNRMVNYYDADPIPYLLEQSFSQLLIDDIRINKITSFVVPSEPDLYVSGTELIMHERFMWQITHQLTTMGNCLKNKKWSQEEKISNRDNIETAWANSLLSILSYLSYLEVTPSRLLEIYSTTAAKNLKRIKGGY